MNPFVATNFQKLEKNKRERRADDDDDDDEEDEERNSQRTKENKGKLEVSLYYRVIKFIVIRISWE